MDIMKNTTQKVKEEEKQNFNDLNDYLKNYSHLTFDEYRKIKNGYVKEENIVNDDNTEQEVITVNNKKSKRS